MLTSSTVRCLTFLIFWFSGLTVFPATLPAEERSGSSTVESQEEDTSQPPVNVKPAHSIVEARDRARLLHETLHGALQVIHRDFFREEESLKIPSRSLEDVFREIARQHNVKLRWIAVDLKAMNIDNEAESEFEKAAVKALKSGQSDYEQTADGEYRFAGRIRLSATCLSCHASRRSSNADRTAGLVIRMPLAAAK